MTIENFINPTNALVVIRFFLNLEISAFDEKFFKIGISNFVDLEQTKRLRFYASHADVMPSQKSDSLTAHAISLTTLLNDEAKKDLVDFLAINQSY